MIPYEKFVTGYTYREISDMVYHQTPWHKAHHTRRGHAVLGLWREIKLEMYRRYENEMQQLEDIPF